MDAVTQPELSEDAPDVGLDRRFLDDERRGDLAVREAASDQPEHLALAGGELVQAHFRGGVTRRRWTAERPQSGADRARDILAERYARGEITIDEYRERLEQLR